MIEAVKGAEWQLLSAMTGNSSGIRKRTGRTLGSTDKNNFVAQGDGVGGGTVL